jgi:glycosyltransferase involved in cell wall biosynthesis
VQLGQAPAGAVCTGGFVAESVKRSRPLRVFMTADAVGGVWQYALDLAEGLRSHDVAVTLAVLGPSPSTDQCAAAERSGVALLDTGLPLDWIASRPDDVEIAGTVVASLAVEANPDIVHLNAPALAAGMIFSRPLVAFCHSCVATWWQANRSGALPGDFAWRAELVRRGYAAADALVAPTAAFADATMRTYGLAKAPRVVRNGRRAAPSVDAGIEDYVFTAGRLWDDGKNLAALDRAAARLDAPVFAAGPATGPNGTHIDLSHVRTLGRLSDAEVARHLGARPIFVSTARYEPFGLAVLEAAQAGCALVLSDIPTFRELWDGAAAFVAPDDDAAIALAVEHLLRDHAARARLGRFARERSRDYGIHAMSEGMLAVYTSVLAARDETRPPEEAAA